MLLEIPEEYRSLYTDADIESLSEWLEEAKRDETFAKFLEENLAKVRYIGAGWGFDGIRQDTFVMYFTEMPLLPWGRALNRQVLKGDLVNVMLAEGSLVVTLTR